MYLHWSSTSCVIGARCPRPLFFAKGRSFPVAMITFMILRVVGQVADLGVALMFPATAARIGPAAYGSLAGSGLVAAIWVPYLVRSRRVEVTFIR